MLFADGALSLVLFGLWVFCLIDVITTDESLCRNLPKPMWILLVVILFDLGAVVWLVAGRTWPSSAATRGPASPSSFPEYDRPGRFAATSGESDEEFLRRCRERAEEQRLRHRQSQRPQDEVDGDA